LPHKTPIKKARSAAHLGAASSKQFELAINFAFELAIEATQIHYFGYQIFKDNKSATNLRLHKGNISRISSYVWRVVFSLEVVAEPPCFNL
jgi:hypothetical protein